MKKSRKHNAEIPSAENLKAIVARQKRPMRMDGLLRVCSLPRSAKRQLEERLASLEKSGELVALPGGAWSAAENLKYVTGQYVSLKNGGVVKPEDSGREIFVHPLRAGDALHKDVVKVAIVPGGDGRQGKVVEIIKRRVGDVAALIVKKERDLLLCKPADWHVKVNFSVPITGTDTLAKKLKPGVLVSVHPEAPLAPDLWSATLVNIYGAENKIDVQEALVKCNHKVPAAFPPLALAQAEAAPQNPSEEDRKNREDWRNTPFVTIDGADARDFDDAICVEKRGREWILRVAIADVSHYVRPDSRQGSLDAEALRRGNSWYFPRSVEPMLPKSLSNGLCSLNPGEDRLAVMAEIVFNERGEPIKKRFAPIVMRSAGRLIYDNVAILFDGEKNGEAPGIDPKLIPHLKTARELFKLLEARRRERGSLDFDLPEPAYSFGDDGLLSEMGFRERNDAHKMVEEFMIAANEAAARWMSEKGRSVLYRVHPRPDDAKLATLFETLRAIAPELLPPGAGKNGALSEADLQLVLKKAKGSPREYVVNKLCLRAMQQARYQPENVGHYGLASGAYCHFTSPIRRYADLLVHRAIKNEFGDKIALPENDGALADIGDQLNKLEREAVDCEREIAKRLACLALTGHEGETVHATVSGVTDFGVFVELDSIPAEGLIRLESLGDDWFEFDPATQSLIGRGSGQVWRLGQRVKTRIVKVDRDRLEIRLEPAEAPRPKGARSKGKADSPRGKKTSRTQSPRKNDRENKTSHRERSRKPGDKKFGRRSGKPA